MSLIRSYLFYASQLAILLLWDLLLRGATLISPRSFDSILGQGATLMMRALVLLGWRLEIKGREHVPTAGPLVVVSNHQSLFDIPLLIHTLRPLPTRFVAKHELRRLIPCVSFVLRWGRSALIDRKNPSQAIPTIRAFGKRIRDESLAGCIFPEGTRSRNGQSRPFKSGGVEALLNPELPTTVLPVTIDGSWRLFAPRRWGVIEPHHQIHVTIHPPVPLTAPEVIKRLPGIESLIVQALPPPV